MIFSVMTRMSTYHLIVLTAILVGQKVSSHGSCNDERTKALEKVGESTLVGAFVPECDSGGYHKTTQCHASTGQCWCVERETGHEIEGTRVNPGQLTVNCNAAQPDSCKNKRTKALAGAGLVGVFVPQCDSDGIYNTQQCHASTGQCWCVKRDTGNEIEETRVNPGQQTINCNAAQPDSCNNRRTTALAEAGLVGVFVSQCDSDGNYKTQQCHASTGQCWCVKRDTGNEIDGTRVNPGQQKINCIDAQPDSCNNKRTKALAEAGLVGVFVHQCDSDGNYKTQQCHTSTGQCWCVKRDSGKEIDGTRVNPGQQTINCNAAQPDSCNNKRTNALEDAGVIGAFVPQCDFDGNYKTKQCHGSTGQCWCVTRNTGKEIEGTRVNPGQQNMNCIDAQPDSCKNKRTKALAEVGLVGVFVHQCDSDGNYKTQQCHASTGQCWCVKRDSGNEIDGTRVNPGQQTINCNAAQPDSCKNKRTGALEEVGAVGVFVLKCDSRGNYKPKQCYGSTGQCWCVKRNTGNEIEGTRVNPGQQIINCNAAQRG